jgi:large subunit ribosomal protein L18
MDTKKPKIVVFKSNKYLYAQLVTNGKTVASVNKVIDVVSAGKEMGEKILKLKISEIIFDRHGNRYHGKIKQFADAVREAGVKF